MKVVYSIQNDGWIRCQTARPAVTRGFGPIEISEKAWRHLSGGHDVIPCRTGLTDTEHLIAAIAHVDSQP